MSFESVVRSARRHWALRYGAAAAFTILAFSCVLVVRPLQQTPLVCMLAAVALSARYCGFGPGVFSGFLSASLVTYFLFLPRHIFPMHSDNVMRGALFLVVSVLISSIAQQRSEAVEAAEELGSNLATVVTSSEDAILTKTLDGTITSWNAGAERLYGYTAKEAVGKNVSMLVSAENADQLSDIFEKLRRGARIERFPTQRVRKDGSRVHISLSISPIRNAAGEIVGASSIAHDVTAKKIADEQLQAARQDLAAAYDRLRLAQQAASIGTWEWDIASGKVTWSAEMEASQGFAPGTFDGTFEAWQATIHPDDRQWVRASLESAIQQNHPYDVEYRALRQDGSTYWTAGRGNVISENGVPRKLVGICMDIDARKRTEETLRRSEKLAAAGRLAATMAHEINNPLESTVNLVFLARNDPQLNPDTRTYLESADRELTRVAHLARQTLGFYRDTSRAVRLRISEICDEVLDLYSRKLQSKSVTARKQYIGETEVMAIAGEMRQLFSNLLANAIDAVPKGGHLVLRISPGSDWSDGRKGVRVTVADNGCGVGQQDVVRIFEPFYTTKQAFGTGLGLWLVHTIVTKHGGSIHVRSSVQPGRNGTAISVFLPHAPAESASAKVA